MTLKEIFEKSEDGVLTYEQFEELKGDSKFVDLSEGGYVSKRKYDNDITAKDTDIETLNNTISQRDVDLQNIKTQLEAAGTDSEKLNALNESFSALQTKYEDDVKAYRAQLAKQAYEFAVRDFANTKKFSSNAAKRDFISTMMSKELKMEDGRIMGAEDFAVAYSNDNSDAFIVDTPPVVEEVKPQFVAPTNVEVPTPKSLTDLMKLKNDNPDTIISF